MVQAASERSPWQAPGDPLTIPAEIQGAKVVFIANFVNIPYFQQLISGMEDAAAVAGLTVEVLDQQGSLANASKLVTQAASQGAAVIVLAGTPAKAIATAVEEATAQGVMVLEYGQQEFGPLSEEAIRLGVAGQFNVCSSCMAETIAQFVYVDAGGQPVEVGIINSSDQIAATDETDAFRAELSRLCPDCSSNVVDVPTGQWATGLGAATTSLLASPGLRYIFATFDGTVPNIVPALESAGATDRVKIVTVNASPSVVQEMQGGGPIAANIGYSAAWAGWAVIDTSLRVLTGEVMTGDGDTRLPIRLITTDNIDSLDLETTDYGSWFSEDDVAANFEALWGLD